MKKITEKKIKMSIKLVNLTMFPEFANGFALQNLYELLPCVPINGIYFDPGKPLPYFGTDGIIISLKSYLYGSRGFRCQTKDGKYPGAMKNCISVDFQYISRNTNIKMFKTKFHICSLDSEDEGEEIMDFLMKMFQELEDVWRPFYNLSFQEREDFIIELILPVISDDNGNLLKTSDPEINDKFEYMISKLAEINALELIDAAKLIISYVDFCKTIDDFIVRSKTLMYLEVNPDSVFTISGKVEFVGFENTRGIYDGNLHQSDIILRHIAKELLNAGINCSYSNEKGKTMEIITSTGLEDGKLTPTSLIHQISINDTGTIKVFSPGKVNVVITETKRIIKMIEEIIDSDEYPRKTKSQMGKKLRQHVVNNNSRTIVIDSPTTSIETLSSDEQELM